MFSWLQIHNTQKNYTDRPVFYSRASLGLRCRNGMHLKVQATVLKSGQRSKTASWDHHHKMIFLQMCDLQSGGWFVHMNKSSCQSYLASKAGTILIWGADAGEGGIVTWIFLAQLPLLSSVLWFCGYVVKIFFIKDCSLGDVYQSLKISEEEKSWGEECN